MGRGELDSYGAGMGKFQALVYAANIPSNILII
jgi:hypothetical protein